VDFDKYEVIVKGRKVQLSPTETKLLFFFARNPGRVYTRDQLLDQVWGGEIFVTPRNVDVHVSRLRKHIEKDPQNPEFIVTVTSVGYKLDDSSA
jgi:two-component system alkaline phosphatase synthesis response regulator PhoP